MNPSDTETSDSTSSSSFGGPGSVEHVIPGENAAARLPPPRQAHKSGEGSSAEHVRSASTPPSYLRDTDSGGQSRQEGALARGSQRDTPEESSSEDDDKITRSTARSPARHHTKLSSTAARNQTGYTGNTAQMSPGANVSSSRQRPLSAPPKAYPFARHVEPPRTQTPAGTEESRGATSRIEEANLGDSPRRYGRDTGVLHWDDGNTDRGVRGRDGGPSGGGGENRTAQERLSLSSIFGASSERRVSEERRPKARSSPFLDEKRKNGKSRKAVSGLQEESEEGCGKVNGTAVPLSSQEFGLHRWKEYAVLRHGNNRLFVNSQHGREILVETAATIHAEKVEDLNRELKEMRALVEELHSALRTEQIEKSTLQAKVVLLEQEVEGMDLARRRWLREDTSNRGRGSNLERRLVGNTGNLRTFLFGAGAKPDTARLTIPEASLAASSSRQSATRSRLHSGGGGGGGTTTSERSSTGEEEDGDMALAKGNAVRRARETAELERSELRRRHGVEMSAKQSRIEKLKLEIRKLEAERDGLKQAAESQAGLFKEGYAELKACLEEMKTHRTPPPSCGPTGSSSATEVDRSLSQDKPSRKAHHRHHHHCRRPSGPTLPDAVSRPAVASVRADTGKVLMEEYSDVATNGGTKMRTPGGQENAEGGNPLLETRGTGISSGIRNDDDGGSNSCTGSEGSGTLWVRIMPTDENSSEEELESPRPPVTQHDDGTSNTERRGREEILRAYLGGGSGGGGAETKTTRGAQQQRVWTAKAQAKDNRKRTESSTTSSSSRGVEAYAAATGAAKGSNRSLSPDSSSDVARAPHDLGREGRLHSDSDKKRPGVKRDNRLERIFVTDLAAAESLASEGGVVGSKSRAAGSRPCLFDAAKVEGLKGPLVEGVENHSRRTGRNDDEAWSNRGH